MSQRPFLSETWFRVSGLRPQLRGHARVHRHRYRGKTWHVIQDTVTGDVFRLSDVAHVVIGLMDGRRTLDVIWREAARIVGDEAPTQDEVVTLLTQLGSADLIQTQIVPDAGGLASRGRKTRWRKLLRDMNPLAVRLPLCDPDRFLERTLPAVGWMFGRMGALLWLSTVITAIVLAGQNAAELASGLSSQLLAARNLLPLALCYVCLKIIHELGHAYAVKVRGGEVHQLGVLILILAPVPYVDASAASAFRRRRDRVLVGAAGMLAEVFVASCAMAVWLVVEDGTVRSTALNVIAIAGISTVVFNINPLLRFDGYYMLSDALEIPNLAQRANAYWGYLVDRYVIDLDHAVPVDADAREKAWLIAYAPAAFAYRVVVLLVIALVVASEYMVVGAALAIWTIALGVVAPVVRLLAAVFAGRKYERKRMRAVGVTLACVSSLAALVAFVPMPSHTNSEGVVWLPEAAIVRSSSNAFIKSVSIEPGQLVTGGQELIRLEEPGLATEGRIRLDHVRELRVKHAAERHADRARAELTGAELRLAEAELDHTEQRLAKLSLKAAVDGTFTVMQPQDLPGRYVREGQEIGYVLPSGSRIVRAVVLQDNFELVRNRLKEVRIKLARRLTESISARIVREVPAGGSDLPSKALGEAGGGVLPVDPRDGQGRKTPLRLFEVDIELPPEHVTTASFGSRAYVRFEHDWEPLGSQAWRRIRQLLLSRLST